METLSFRGRVAVITGAGNGLGREHALLLAQRGAAIVVNDVGVSVNGIGADRSVAESVTDEIHSAGGDAIADMHSVANYESARELVTTAIAHYGRIDIVINNAGILRDKSFGSMTPDLLDPVLDVHLRGAFFVTQAAWPHLRERQFGRIISTTSAAGLFGNFGQANYAAAKLGIVGMTHVLAIEGAKHNITANAIAPIARTRMTENLLGKLVDRLDPKLVSPLVGWLAHSNCQTTGHIYSVGGGRIARVFIGLSDGWTQRDGQLTIEDVHSHFDEIDDTSRASIPTSIADEFRVLRDALR